MQPGSADRLKLAAAERALQMVEPGMTLGLGTGSTAVQFIDGVGRLVAGGMALTAVATSADSAARARRLGIRVLDEVMGRIDLAVDGADEIDPDLGLIKGRGGALFREKVVAASARSFVVIADRSKLVPRLGTGAPVPVEVLPFLWRTTAARLDHLAGWVVRGGEETPFLTDNGNLILDLRVEGGIEDPERLAAALRAIVGVVEHGLFLGLAGACVVAGEAGVEVLTAPGRR